ncbi:MAG TPA: cyclase family protein [Steroidobacteraceae bacterium]|nr:cyclase family protein [Steroidobacteraceae bacterium]
MRTRKATIVCALASAFGLIAGTGLADAGPASPAAARMAAAPPLRPVGLWSIYERVLARARYVDLTHTFGTDTPHWKGFGDMTVTPLYTIAKNGFHVDRYCHVGQWGTHVDAPSHFHRGLKSIDQISPRDMLMPLVVLDVHEKVARDPDYMLSLADVHAWEQRYGRIPQHAFVAMRTDWSKRWPNQAAMQNSDAHGAAHYPGWSMPVLKFLFDQRHVAAIGHETTDTDRGLSVDKNDYSLESYVLSTDHYQIEMLAHLDRVPDAGALVMVSFPKPAHGTGFPARVIAIVPASAHTR